MEQAEKMDCRENGEAIFTGVTTEFQLKKGLIPEYLREHKEKGQLKMRRVMSVLISDSYLLSLFLRVL